jgi:hypothetical protein
MMLHEQYSPACPMLKERDIARRHASTAQDYLRRIGVIAVTAKTPCRRSG